MRRLRQLDRYRIPHPTHNAGDTEGVFLVPHEGYLLRVIASVGQGWDHLSVSLEKRIPTWEEMDFIANLFFLPHEYAYQLHVPRSDHINRHPNVLHWWRPHHTRIPLPPKEFV